MDCVSASFEDGSHLLGLEIQMSSIRPFTRPEAPENVQGLELTCLTLCLYLLRYSLAWNHVGDVRNETEPASGDLTVNDSSKVFTLGGSSRAATPQHGRALLFDTTFRSQIVTGQRDQTAVPICACHVRDLSYRSSSSSEALVLLSVVVAAVLPPL